MSEVISYDYDNLNRVTQTTQTVNSVPYILNYEYDSLGNRTKLTYPDNTYVTYEYDQLNRLKKLMANGSSLIAEYTYDELSRRTQLDYANTTQTTYQYDNLNRLTDIGRTQGAPLHYEYDKVGNRTSMTVDSTDVHSYTYDNIYQLTNVDYPTNSTFSDTNYNYDDLGNRDTVVDSATTSYTSNEVNQYTDVGGTTFSYDDNGNLTNDSTWTHTYDYENRLISSTDGTTNVTYSYDSFGRRIHKSVIGSLSSDIWYSYDGDQVIGEYDENGVLLRKYVYGVGIDEPIKMTDTTNNQSYYYHFDGLGSVTSLTNSSGAVVESYEYDVYGNVIIRDAQDAILNTSQIGNSYLFTGRQFDEETGLYYYRARMYSPELGRFLQTDPIGYYGGINLYSYVSNNPLNYVDPMGLCGKEFNYLTAYWDAFSEGVNEDLHDMFSEGMAYGAGMDDPSAVEPVATNKSGQEFATLLKDLVVNVILTQVAIPAGLILLGGLIATGGGSAVIAGGTIVAGGVILAIKEFMGSVEWAERGGKYFRRQLNKDEEAFRRYQEVYRKK